MNSNKNHINGKLFWTSSSANMAQYPWLSRDENCDVVIIGNGITGAMCAQRLANAGIDTLLIGEKPIGFTATSASQGVVTYQLDAGLLGLSQKIGMDAAVKMFQLCAGTVDAMEDLCNSLETDVEYARRDSFFYTETPTGVEHMRNEYLARKHNEFAVELIEGEKSQDMFSFPVLAGILSAGMACECNPYKLTHALVSDAVKNGARIYENTTVDEIVIENGKNILTTCTGYQITANKVIMAAGFETAKHLRSLSSIKTAFTVVTDPVADFSGWYEQAVLCSDTCPPLRLRTTPDNRIVISGFDCGMPILAKMSKIMPIDTLFNKKTGDLERTLYEMFPGIRGIQPAHSYSFEYAQTFDSMPIIGEHCDTGIYYALCTGENGIAFSMIAADMLLAHFQGNTMPDMYLFSPNR